jgi:hypothetical protein
MEDKEMIRSCRVEYESGVERETSIRYFVERALQDDDATVYDTSDDSEVTNIESVVEPEVAA